MTEGPAGTYTATVAALEPDHGTGEVQIHIDCPGPTDEDVDFGIYIDPSGVVRFVHYGYQKGDEAKLATKLAELTK
mgnify:CR=1 FL=1